MAPVETGIQYRRYRVPRSDGEVFSDPPLADAPLLARRNAALLRTDAPQGSWFRAAEARREARAEIYELARDYTLAYRDVSAAATIDAGQTMFLMTGHQPRLFHPGVWYKNSTLDRLARILDAAAIHLVIDNDLTGSTAIRVPTGNVFQPRLESVPFDRPADDIPLEDRPVLDESCFAAFGARVASLIKPLVDDPLIRQWWPMAMDAMHRSGKLGLSIAQARHALEGQWGLQTLELPLSRVCETNSFRQFLAGLWSDIERFVTVHNEALLEYRRVHGIRSRSHPVPKLETDGTWWEAPCWIWTRDDPRRRRLFIRRMPDGMELTDRAAVRCRLAARGSSQEHAVVKVLADLASQGVRVRPRALLTTLYARWVLSDLFLHGIGGAKYDQLTDVIIRRIFGSEPPQFMVLSATAELPIARPAASHDELRRIERELRDLRYNPDRHLTPTSETQPHIAAKRKWLAANPPRGTRRMRHQAIQLANESLIPHVAPQRERLVARRDELLHLLANARLLGSREFAFCLFPAATLLALLLDK